eukprot:4000276-Amphidinium_carterae.1
MFVDRERSTISYSDSIADLGENMFVLPNPQLGTKPDVEVHRDAIRLSDQGCTGFRCDHSFTHATGALARGGDVLAHVRNAALARSVRHVADATGKTLTL